MKITIFCQSILSDYNFSAAHFLRGIASHLGQNHEVKIFEKESNSSYVSALKESGKTAISEFYRYYPRLASEFYVPSENILSEAVKDIDYVIVHSSSDQVTMGVLGDLKRKFHYKILFYDSCGTIVNDPDSLNDAAVSEYDGILVPSNEFKEKYRTFGFINNVWILRNSADTSVFQPRKSENAGTVILNMDWVGEETGDLINEFFVKPVRDLRVKAKIFGVNYPKSFKKALSDSSDIEYGGWVPSFKLPELYAKYTAAVHIAQNQNQELLRNVPSIKLLEALSCGIPLLTSQWEDSEKLFSKGRDFLMAKDSYEMKHFILEMMNSTLKEVIATHGLKTINSKHTCRQRVDELERIVCEVGVTEKSISNDSNLVVNG